jgi:hypothetical protein
MCNISSSSPTVTNCTFSSNTATWGGGMYNAYYSSPTVTNCILWGDSPDEIFNGGPSTSTPTVSFSDLQGGWPANTVDGGGNIDVDPLFVDADGPDNTIGTEDDNLRLSEGSPCIDSGSFFDFNSLFDLGGNDRYVDDPTTINTGSGVLTFLDMGAYEFQVPPCVHNINTGLGYFTIQAAIDVAGVGHVIEADPKTYFEKINFNGKAITVRSTSGDPADTIIDGGAAGSVVTCDSGETSTTVLDGFTITNGSGFYKGGGMYNSSSSPTVSNCTFSGNTTNFGGGGMYNVSNSNPTVTNCTFSGNTANGSATYGGGMFNNTNCSPTVTNCTFSGNSAVNGGGMRNSSNSSPTVTNCTFSGNTADQYGGGMYNASSSPTVSNCTFSGNTADLYGGGMINYSNSSSPTVTNCILWGNSPNEIFNSSSTLTLSFSDVQGGLPGDTIDGGGNIAVDPFFVDADGPDNTIGTEDDNLRLLDSSPCIDAGSNTSVSAGVTTDLDLVGPRIVNCVVDMGAYEINGAALGDSDGDGTADDCDLCLGFNDNLDADGDNVPDDCDLCPGFDDNGPDADSDGICDNLDVCSGFNDNLDADGDNVPDDCDLCLGFDDKLDADGDNVPDDCDLCPGFDDAIDYDSDGVPYSCDRCGDADDNGPDSDNDGEPDACDTCSLPGDINCDGIVNLLDQALLALHWLETN